MFSLKIQPYAAGVGMLMRALLPQWLAIQMLWCFSFLCFSSFFFRRCAPQISGYVFAPKISILFKYELIVSFKQHLVGFTCVLGLCCFHDMPPPVPIHLPASLLLTRPHVSWTGKCERCRIRYAKMQEVHESVGNDFVVSVWGPKHNFGKAKRLP